jgi:hypothetical protein
VLAAMLLAACSDTTEAGEDGGAGGGGGGASTLVESYLRSAPFTALVLEVDAVPGFEPRASSGTTVEQLLVSLADKPDGVQVLADGAIASLGDGHAYTDAEVIALAEEHFDLSVDAQTTKIHAMFLDGHSARDSETGRILGIAFGNRHLALFAETIADACGSAGIGELFREPLCAAIEETVWIHELGHVLGLVNAGAPMVADHEDDTHLGHDVDEDCVMYWAVEGTALVDELIPRVLGGGQDMPTFDQACLDDLAAIRDRP